MTLDHILHSWGTKENKTSVEAFISINISNIGDLFEKRKEARSQQGLKQVDDL